MAKKKSKQFTFQLVVSYNDALHALKYTKLPIFAIDNIAQPGVVNITLLQNNSTTIDLFEKEINEKCKKYITVASLS